jgi:hypothetical protein
LNFTVLPPEESVTAIGANSFAGKGLIKVTTPGNVIIETAAFKNNNNLKTIVKGANVTLNGDPGFLAPSKNNLKSFSTAYANGTKGTYTYSGKNPQQLEWSKVP